MPQILTRYSIPTEPVGSLPRCSQLQRAISACDTGKISYEDLVRVQDAAVRHSITKGVETGQDICTDGEMRLSSFATYPLCSTLGGTGMHPLLGPCGQTFAVFEDGHKRDLPCLLSGPFKYQNYAADNLRLSSNLAPDTPMKCSVISPSLLYLLYPLEGEIEGYSRDAFKADLVSECIKDIRGCFEAGARRVCIDFTEGRLALKNDTRIPWTCKSLLPTFITLIKEVLAAFGSEERRDIGIHSCRGGDCDSSHSADVPLEGLIPSLFSLDVGYFLVSMSSEPTSTRKSTLRFMAKYLRDDARGVKQAIFLGVTNPCAPKIESPEEIRDVLLEAAKLIHKDRIGATDDCGFGPFSNDVKPVCGGPDKAFEMALKKMKARVEGARMASDILGL